jgi:F-box-like
MDRLSDELLYAILTHLDPWTLVRNIPLVSKRFRRVAFENRLWYAFSPSSHSETFSEKLQLDHWAQIDWQNEWKW